MKLTLAFLLCSYVAESCLPPYIHPMEFDSEYDINTHRMYIKFGCYPSETQGET